MVIQLTRAGVSTFRIALQLHSSQRTVKRVCQHFHQTGSSARLPGTGLLKKTTPNADRYLGRLVSQHRFATLRQVTAMFNDGRATPVLYIGTQLVILHTEDGDEI